jgi:hypothetical protein
MEEHRGLKDSNCTGLREEVVELEQFEDLADTVERKEILQRVQSLPARGGTMRKTKDERRRTREETY